MLTVSGPSQVFLVFLVFLAFPGLSPWGRCNVSPPWTMVWSGLSPPQTWQCLAWPKKHWEAYRANSFRSRAVPLMCATHATTCSIACLFIRFCLVRSCDATFFLGLGPAFWLNHEDISAATSSIAWNTGLANTRDAKASLVPKCSTMFQVPKTINHLRRATAWNAVRKPT